MLNNLKVITIGTLKGGVGKSNFAFNLGGLLAVNNKVLLIDVDPQSNLTLNLGVDITQQEFTIKDIFENNIELNKVIIKSPIKELDNLDLIPSDLILYEMELKIFSYTARESILKRYFEKNIHKLSEYDYVIIDTNPSFSITNQNAFLIADEIILISDVSLNGIQGSELFIALWNSIRENLGKENNINTLILNNLDKRIKLSSELIEFCHTNETLNNIIFENIIFNNIKIKETELEHLPINILYPNSIQHNNYLNLLEELKNKNII